MLRSCAAHASSEIIMIGASISRWTMSYFAMAVTWLFVALALMVAGIGFPAVDLASPDTLILVHVVCIGWLSLAMCGALFQFVPVLVAKPLFSEKWVLPASGLLTAGLASLLAHVDGHGRELPAAVHVHARARRRRPEEQFDAIGGRARYDRGSGGRPCRDHALVRDERRFVLCRRIRLGHGRPVRA